MVGNEVAPEVEASEIDVTPALSRNPLGQCVVDLDPVLKPSGSIQRGRSGRCDPITRNSDSVQDGTIHSKP